MPAPIVLVGAPTSLGGHFGGMERTPSQLRARGLGEALASAPGLAQAAIDDRGDAPVEPGWAPDPDPRAKNRALLVANLPRIAEHVADALRVAPPDARLVLVGGDCTANAAALAGVRRGRPGIRLAMTWFDAHGDFNTPDTTPSGNVWGMPFAMACGRGDADLVGAVDGPAVREADAALLGGQVLDETESRMLAASAVAQFGPGMLGARDDGAGSDGGGSTSAGSAGLDALDAWARRVARRVDAVYVAFDLDAIDAGEGLALAMPEPQGMSLDTAVAAVRTIAAAIPVVGFGATAALITAETTVEAGARTIEAIAQLAEAALA